MEGDHCDANDVKNAKSFPNTVLVYKPSYLKITTYHGTPFDIKFYFKKNSESLYILLQLNRYIYCCRKTNYGSL